MFLFVSLFSCTFYCDESSNTLTQSFNINKNKNHKKKSRSKNPHYRFNKLKSLINQDKIVELRTMLEVDRKRKYRSSKITGEDRSRALVYACENERYSSAKQLLFFQLTNDPIVTFEGRETPILEHLIIKNKLDLLDTALKQKQFSLGRNYSRALQRAYILENYEATKILLEYADPTLVSHNPDMRVEDYNLDHPIEPYTILDKLAEKGRKEEIIIVLKRHRYNPRYASDYYEPRTKALLIAFLNGHYDIVTLLSNFSANIFEITKIESKENRVNFEGLLRYLVLREEKKLLIRVLKLLPIEFKNYGLKFAFESKRYSSIGALVSIRVASNKINIWEYRNVNILEASILEEDLQMIETILFNYGYRVDKFIQKAFNLAVSKRSLLSALIIASKIQISSSMNKKLIKLIRARKQTIYCSENFSVVNMLIKSKALNPDIIEELKTPIIEQR